MMLAGAMLTIALAAMAPQGTEPLLRVERDGDTARVSANHAGAPCDLAITELAKQMDWTLRFQPESLRGQLAEQIVDLAFHDEGPRTLATLLATAGDADAVFHERELDGARQVDVTIVPPPSADSHAGRARLRRHALTWYRTWLAERIARGMTGDDQEVRVRWQIAELLRGEGDLEEAARIYATIAAEDGNTLVPEALLKLASVEFDMGPEHWPDAERQVRELTRMHPESPQAIDGVLLLGRLLLATGHARECATTIQRAYVRLTGTPELAAAYLLMARAQLRLGDADAARAALRQLAAVRSPASLPPAQRREELLLRGLSEVARGASLAAIEALTELLGDAGTAPDERAQAYVGLGEACLLAGRAVHAASASVAARAAREHLDDEWRARATALEARVAFAVGEDERGYTVLEDALRSESVPELAVMLAERLLAGGRMQRADEVAATLDGRDDRFGDRARLVRVEAGLSRAQGTIALAAAIDAASQRAAAIRDANLESRADAAIAAAALDAHVAPDAAAGPFGAQATLLAGLTALAESRELERRGDHGAARERRAAAETDLAKARAAFAPAAAEPDAPLADLFGLARCEEALGHDDAARALFEEIVTRDADPSTTADDARTGPFGRAAGTALAVRRWLDDTGGWTPAVDVDTIRWPRR